MMMIIILLILSMFLYIVASKFINWFRVCIYVFSGRSHRGVSVHIRNNFRFTSTIELSTAFKLVVFVYIHNICMMFEPKLVYSL